jgi:hypothetical protein
MKVNMHIYSHFERFEKVLLLQLFSNNFCKPLHTFNSIYLAIQYKKILNSSY